MEIAEPRIGPATPREYVNRTLRNKFNAVRITDTLNKSFPSIAAFKYIEVGPLTAIAIANKSDEIFNSRGTLPLLKLDPSSRKSISSMKIEIGMLAINDTDKTIL